MRIDKVQLGVEETETTINAVQFDPGECIEGGLDNGETMATTDIAEGVQGVVCRRKADAEPETQAVMFDKGVFPTVDDAKAWAEANGYTITEAEGGTDDAAAAEMRRNAFVEAHPVRFRGGRMPAAVNGVVSLADDGVLNANDGMLQTKANIEGAIMAQGWSIFATENPEFDFIVAEVFDTDVVVIDYLTGKYYKVPYTVGDDGAVTLGVPSPVDLAFTDAGGAGDANDDDAGAPPAGGDTEAAAASRKPGKAEKARVRMFWGIPKRVRGASGDTPEGKGKRPVYEFILLSSGYTADGRFIEHEAVQDAVARGLFDGAQCNVQHPAPEHDASGYRPHLPCGMVIPGTVVAKENKAGGFDAVGQVILANTDDGREVAELADLSLEQEAPLLGASIYGEAHQKWDKRDNRTVKVLYRFKRIDAVDFVDRAAFPRATVVEKVAANRNPQTQGATQAMNTQTPAELAKLRNDNTELRKENEKLARAAHVAEILAKSCLPADKAELARPILMGLETPELRTANLQLHERLHLAEMKVAPASSGGDGGNGGGEADGTLPWSESTKATMSKLAAAHGITPEKLAEARKRVNREVV